MSDRRRHDPVISEWHTRVLEIKKEYDTKMREADNELRKRIGDCYEESPDPSNGTHSCVVCGKYSWARHYQWCPFL